MHALGWTHHRSRHKDAAHENVCTNDNFHTKTSEERNLDKDYCCIVVTLYCLHQYNVNNQTASEVFADNRLSSGPNQT